MADILLFAFLDFMATSASRSIRRCKNLTAWFGRMKARPSAAARRCLFSSFSRRTSRHENGDVFNKTQGPEMRRLIALFVSHRHACARCGRAPPRPAPPVKGLLLLTDYPVADRAAGRGRHHPLQAARTPACRPSRWRCRSTACRPAGRSTSWAAASRSPRRCRASTRTSACSFASTCRRTPSPARRRSPLSAKGAHAQAIDLPLTLTVGTEAPAKLSHEVAPAVAVRHAALGLRVHASRSATTAART